MSENGVSMIVAVKNGESTIADCISSIRRHAFGDVEIIVVNDNSGDDTLNVLNQLSGPDLIVVNSGEDLGRAHARNLAVQYASKRWISILDGDDVCTSQRFIDLHRILETSDNVDVISGAMAYLAKNGRAGRSERVPRTKEDFLNSISEGFMPIPHGGLTIRRELFLKIGGYRDFERAQDFDLVCRMKTLNWVFSSNTHYLYRRTLLTSFRVFKMTEKNRIEILKINNIPTKRPLPIFLRYLFRESKRLLKVWT